MRRINTSTKATDLHGPGKHGFKAGNSLTGELPTQLSPVYCDDVQEEIANAIEGAGITLGADQSQLLAAIIALADQRAALRASFTGQPSYCFGLTAPAGWVRRHGGTIGNAISGATERNHADTEALFTLIWEETDNADYHIQDSAGTPTIRGANAAADFAANKRMPLPDDRGSVDVGLNASATGKDPNRVLGSYQEDAIQNITGTVGEWPQYFSDNPAAAAGPFYYDANGSGTPPNVGGSAGKGYVKFDASRTVRTSTFTRMSNRAYTAIMKL
jgi:hypothetical protein